MPKTIPAGTAGTANEHLGEERWEILCVAVDPSLTHEDDDRRFTGQHERSDPGRGDEWFSTAEEQDLPA